MVVPYRNNLYFSFKLYVYVKIFAKQINLKEDYRYYIW